jgi:hypothetical protein
MGSFHAMRRKAMRRTKGENSDPRNISQALLRKVRSRKKLFRRKELQSINIRHGMGAMDTS